MTAPRLAGRRGRELLVCLSQPPLRPLGLPQAAAAQQPGNLVPGRFPHIRNRRCRYRLPGPLRQRYQGAPGISLQHLPRSAIQRSHVTGRRAIRDEVSEYAEVCLLDLPWRSPGLAGFGCGSGMGAAIRGQLRSDAVRRGQTP
jgi:hypothetical protein